MSPHLSTIDEAFEALRAGLPVLVADDENRENEGDVILAAATMTTHWLAWTIRHTSGYICAPMSQARADRLNLPPMVADNRDPHGTAYTVTVDAAAGVNTRISAADRAHTIRLLALSPRPRRTSTARATWSRCVPGRAGSWFAVGTQRRL